MRIRSPILYLIFVVAMTISAFRGLMASNQKAMEMLAAMKPATATAR